MLVSLALLGLLLVIHTKSENGLAGLYDTTVDSKVKMDIKTMPKTLLSHNEEKSEQNSLISNLPLKKESRNSGRLISSVVFAFKISFAMNIKYFELSCRIMFFFCLQIFSMLVFQS